MAISNFQFTKSWNNPEDFAPVVSNATQARANIQLLHDETRDYINAQLVAAITNLENTVATLSRQVGGAVTVSPTPPTNTDGLWVDTGNENVIKFYNGTAWETCAAVWK